MKIGKYADGEILQGVTGNNQAATDDFNTHLIPNYIGPRSAADAGNTHQIHILSRVGGPVTRTDGDLIEQRDEMRNYRIVGRLPYRQATPPDVTGNPVVQTVGNAATGSLIGKLLGAIGLG